MDSFKALEELLSASKKFLRFYNDLADSNPGFMGKLNLQDYAQWNEAMIELPKAIKTADKFLRRPSRHGSY